MNTKKAGRPVGSDYKEDAAALALMADLIVTRSATRPTAAARQVYRSPRWKGRGASEAATIDRLVKKWHSKSATELAAARKRIAAAVTAVRLPVHRSMVAIARSIPHGPPKLEFGLGQSHAIAAAARRERLRGAMFGEPTIAVDSRLLDALRSAAAAGTGPYKALVEEIRKMTGADIVRTSDAEALRLIAETKREILRRYGPRSG